MKLQKPVFIKCCSECVKFPPCKLTCVVRITLIILKVYAKETLEKKNSRGVRYYFI